MKRLDKLPSHVKKPCGSQPGPDDTQHVASGDGSLCGHRASYVVEVDGIEVLVCGSHRRTFQEGDDRVFPEVLKEVRFPQEASP